MESAAIQRPALYVTPLPAVKPGVRPIRRVLIANRGEIACRIAATCKRLNITSIAIYVDEDADSRHVYEADESICLGSITSPDGNPFLNVDILVKKAVEARADAVHPGYGYLSENGGFADAIRKAGIIFVGPSSEAIATLGDKRQSKEYLRKHAPAIPLVPGFAGSSQSVDDLEAAAADIGYPVMLKASAGGGGRGMRIVQQRAALRENLERAQSEAKRSFGSSDCILEKYIESAKHIEIQIVGDSHGTVIALWERECSVQRRHQKVVEESPSPFLTPAQRQAMCAAAVELGKLILYEGAGTVEFVVDATTGKFYFLEVNTRLQVEHPVTEEITGLDIVALQLFVAFGGRLSEIPQLRKLPRHGHAIECRLCAEDPSNNFAPENGTISLWHEAKFAAGSRDIRYEAAVHSGSKISIYFDSMIAKVVVWAPTRDLAIAKMVRVLANTACVGLKTNQLFLQSCLLHPGFREPTYDTSFIPNNLEALLRNPHIAEGPETMGMLAAIPALLVKQPSSGSESKPFRNIRRSFKNQVFDCINSGATIIQPPRTADPVLCVWDGSRDADPTSLTISRVADAPPSPEDDQRTTAQKITSHYTAFSQQLRQLQADPTSETPSTRRYHVELRKAEPIVNNSGERATYLTVAINNRIIHALTPYSPNSSPALSFPLSSTAAPHTIAMHFPTLGTWLPFTVYSPLTYFESLRNDIAATSANTAAGAQRTIHAPMPCKVLDVLKKEGEVVQVGEAVMVVESMKMETSISCGMGGVFRCQVGKGEAVDEGRVLCWFEEVEVVEGEKETGQ
jgi:acetyl/propionyl-CoA carboxylase alpha subunit